MSTSFGGGECPEGGLDILPDRTYFWKESGGRRKAQEARREKVGFGESGKGESDRDLYRGQEAKKEEEERDVQLI